MVTMRRKKIGKINQDPRTSSDLSGNRKRSSISWPYGRRKETKDVLIPFNGTMESLVNYLSYLATISQRLAR